MDLLHDGRRHARRPEQAIPVQRFHAIESGFLERHRIGEERHALIRRHANHAQIAALHVGQCRQHAGESGAHMAADHIDHDLCAALVRHRNGLEIARLAQQFAGQSRLAF
ncbi:hypothetical protein D3C81_1745740 [compost metagenome]